MQIGIEFFDKQEPKPGDLWLVASGPSMGKSTVLRNIAVGIADNLDGGRITYWDLEQTYAAWRSRIEKMGCDVPATLTYRNDSAYLDGHRNGEILPALNLGAPSGTAVVVIDHFDLFTETHDAGLKTLKIWLVRTGKFGIVSMSLPREVWGNLKAEGEIHPDSLPEHMLDNADAVFACGKTPQRAIDNGDADTLRVVVCKTPTGLRDPHNYHAFIWNHKTGRIS
jgi:predicted ATP-dependent serine protease